ncbi:metal-dependent hydrolase [Endozoicomonas sp. SM1973]|uniref:Metal-dependent hydrolase n=1 Tax=Spartinivicinus marinus TaxID=2994442 RepID=A0A853HTV1_9GAMM|nr:metal-dependent hydrolase [Spartinivicinus marinus]MCX4030052.1 metal-dependent hydrolase [Spartinivicinus marinus]NYZ64703.1 metal-dependent hydrolase [Spartinivicinus marinus]
MASLLTHPVVPIVLGLALKNSKITFPLLLAAAVASILPDLDVIAFYFGIPYASPFGHRGFTHSISFSILVGLIGMMGYRVLNTTPLWAFIGLFIGSLSHPFLDAMTNGGLGVAWLWPWDDHRYFFPDRPIQVSPIGVSRFLSERGWHVLWSELQWVWLPMISAGLIIYGMRVSCSRFFKKEL